MKDYFASSLGSLYKTWILIEFCYEDAFFPSSFSFLYECMWVNVYVDHGGCGLREFYLQNGRLLP